MTRPPLGVTGVWIRQGALLPRVMRAQGVVLDEVISNLIRKTAARMQRQDNLNAKRNGKIGREMGKWMPTHPPGVPVLKLDTQLLDEVRRSRDAVAPAAILAICGR